MKILSFNCSGFKGYCNYISEVNCILKLHVHTIMVIHTKLCYLQAFQSSFTEGRINVPNGDGKRFPRWVERLHYHFRPVNLFVVSSAINEKVGI